MKYSPLFYVLHLTPVAVAEACVVMKAQQSNWEKVCVCIFFFFEFKANTTCNADWLRKPSHNTAIIS